MTLVRRLRCHNLRSRGVRLDRSGSSSFGFGLVYPSDQRYSKRRSGRLEVVRVCAQPIYQEHPGMDTIDDHNSQQLDECYAGDDAAAISFCPSLWRRRRGFLQVK